MPLLFILLLVFAAEPENTLQRFEFRQIHMGSAFELVLYAPDAAIAKSASAAAFRRIAELDQALSDYQPESELNRLCRTAGSGRAVPVSRDLLTVLTKSVELSKRTDGRFDVTVGPLVKLWRASRKSKRLVESAELAAARALVDYKQIEIDSKQATVKLLRAGMQLDLGGIAGGYAVEEALAVLKSQGVTRALIDCSGDIGVSDAPPGREGWRIGVAPLEAEGEPSVYLTLKNAAVTTSGDAFQFVEIEGQRYSHIVDPHTGLGLTTRSSVTVVGPNCTLADSYATAVTLLGPEKGLKLIEETPGTAALIVIAISGEPQSTPSKRWPEFVK